MTILLVEDNPKTRAVLKKMLFSQIPAVDFVLECDDGRTAVELYARSKPDWVLMDIALKNVDGLHAAREIRRTDGNSRIIILTMYDDRAYRETARDIGVCDYVLKENLFEIIEIMKP